MIRYSLVFENGTEEQKAAVRAALDLAHEKLATIEFQNAVINFTQPDGTKGFYQANMTNKQVYDQLMNTPWNYSVSFYSKRFTSANAYVNPGDPTVNLNWYMMSGWPSRSIANTLVHENTHLKGFDHDYQATSKRPYSVPYAVGSIIETLLGGGKPEPVKYYVPWWKRIFRW